MFCLLVLGLSVGCLGLVFRFWFVYGLWLSFCVLVFVVLLGGFVFRLVVCWFN